MAVGNLVTLEICDDGLHIKLEPEGREFLESQIDSKPNDDCKFYIWDMESERMLWELMEYYVCNGGPEPISTESNDRVFLGALTAAPIIAYDVDRNDQGDLVSVGRVFWFPNYMVEGELDTLFETGEVVFQEAK